VLLAESLELLEPRPGEIWVDGTLGGGGHAAALLARVEPTGRVIALDRDAAAVARASERFATHRFTAAQANFCDLPEVLASLDVAQIDGILLDLGISSDQLADRDRGFSFDADGPLDLRMDTSRGTPAWRLVNTMSQENLANLIYENSEERFSRRIARRIVEARRSSPIETAAQLAALLRAAVPRGKGPHRIDPATRTFQALRIAVNDEIKSLNIALRRLPDCLRGGGRFGVISFHSLEDRPVKHAFREDARLRVLTRRPVRPGAEEIAANARSRSAKLRVAVRV
jgi:16S rRNA (cytosine1402-N4)-methyltransferase